VAHILRALREVLATKRGRAWDLGEWLKVLLPEAIKLWRAYHAGSVTDRAAQAQSLQEPLTYQLRSRI
jgi:hypothetical protein